RVAPARRPDQSHLDVEVGRMAERAGREAHVGGELRVGRHVWEPVDGVRVDQPLQAPAAGTRASWAWPGRFANASVLRYSHAPSGEYSGPSRCPLPASGYDVAPPAD